MLSQKRKKLRLPLILFLDNIMNYNVDFAFLDSGTGGLPYLLHLKEKCPNARCVYFADTKNFPYGEKSHEEILDCTVKACKLLIEKFSPRVIVLACNTMSVNSLSVLRELFTDHLFVGTVPAIKLASEISKKRRLGLLATKSTIENPYNLDLKKHFADDCQLICRADSKLISFIEHKSFEASIEDCKNACRPAVKFFADNDCDVIILGCTHFLNISHIIAQVAGESIKVVDSREGVVNQALKLSGLLEGNEGALRGLPAREGSEQELVNEGETSPFENIPLLFVSGFSDKKDEFEYNEICRKFGLKFCKMV